MCNSVHRAVTKSNNKNSYSALEKIPGNVKLFQTGSKLDILFLCNLTCLMIKFFLSFYTSTFKYCGPGSSVGIATELRTGRSGIEFQWGRDFPAVQTGPGAHPASCKAGTESFPGVKCGRGVLLTTHPLLVPLSRKSRAILLPTLWATLGL